MEIPTICLNMIVKNEADKIERCLSSLVNYIDYYVISDTGSTDGTQEKIKEFFDKHGIQGEVLQHEWKNFRDNRNYALFAAKDKADFIMLVDADMELRVIDKDFKKKLNKQLPDNRIYNTNKITPDHVADLYRIKQGQNKRYFNTRIINGRKNFRYEAITHEYLTPMFPGAIENRFEGIYFYDNYDGSNRKEKYTRDIKLLKQGLEEEPDNKRYFFYLGQSYFEINDFENAIHWYTKRAEAGGWHEEAAYAMTMVGHAYKETGKSSEDIVNAYLKSFDLNKARLEPLFYAIEYLNKKELYDRSYQIGKKYNVDKFPYPNNDLLFIINDIYEYKCKDEFAVACYWTGHYTEGIAIWTDELIENKFKGNPRTIKRIRQNIQFCLDRLNEKLSKLNDDKN